jgi:uncharacterized protein
MIADAFVVDAVVHPYNWTPENAVGDFAVEFSRGNHAYHEVLTPDPSYRLTQQEFMRDWTIEELADVLFVEGGVDYAICHAVGVTDFYRDGLSSVTKAAEMASRWPQRVGWYATVNPFEGTRALESLEHQVADLGACGLKLYPARYDRGRTQILRMNDEKVTFPVIERARKLGVHAIGVHKAVPDGLNSTEAYRVDDLDEACACFPDVRFEVVHAGFAFLEETALQLGRHPNLYATLEVTFSILMSQPRRFAEILGTLLYWAGPDRILFADGCSLVHPRPGLERFMSFEMPADLIEGYGFPPLTDEIKCKILGENALALHGLDATSLAADQADDEFSRQRAHRGEQGRWEAIREPALDAPT